MLFSVLETYIPQSSHSVYLQKGVANESLLLYVKGTVATSIELSTQYYMERISIFKVINGGSNYIWYRERNESGQVVKVVYSVIYLVRHPYNYSRSL